MRASRWIAVVLCAGAGAFAATRAVEGEDAKPASADVTIPTSRGAKIVANIHLPKTPNGVGVVLAPGQGYHRDLPLLKLGAAAFADAGFTALRFDWAYFTAKGQPSADLATEGDDLAAAVAHVRTLPGVKRLVVVGKSLGSLVALQRARSIEGLAGLVFWTFPITDSDRPDGVREGIDGVLDLPFPTLIAVGDRDPLCPLVPLYGLLARAKKPPSVIVLPGGHSFDLAKDDKARTLEHQRVVIEATVLWARRLD